MPTKREHFRHSLRAQFLGEKMRKLREDRGLTLKYIAAYLGVEFSTLARYERAEWPFRRDHVVALLDVYGVYDERERAELVELAANAWRINQWEPGYGKHNPTAVGDDFAVIGHWWIQGRAEELCVYATTLVPELVQTRDYAEAIIQHGEPILASLEPRLGPFPKERSARRRRDRAGCRQSSSVLRLRRQGRPRDVQPTDFQSSGASE